MHFVVTGPESSGKTSLTIALSRALTQNYIPEYSRYYLTYVHIPPYELEDLVKIADQTKRLQNSSALDKSFIMDTGFLVLKIWSEIRFGHTPIEIEELFVSDDAFYLLCTPDIPWKSGPLRENPNDRHILFERYLKILKLYAKPFQIISGNEEERIKKSREIYSQYSN